MSKRRDEAFVNDIKEALTRIENYTKAVDYKAFLKKTIIQDAVVRNLEIIGEAVKNLSKDLKERYKDIEWKDLAGLRDKIIHHYFGIKWSIVWSIIKDKIPELKEKIDGIIKREF